MRGKLTKEPIYLTRFVRLSDSEHTDLEPKGLPSIALLYDVLIICNQACGRFPWP